MSDPVNMLSDTVTRPTTGMLEAMVNAEVGDDMNALDPTVNRLEAMVAELLGKKAAVYACSGTQSNQMGVRCHTGPGDELLIGQRLFRVYYGGSELARGIAHRARWLDLFRRLTMRCLRCGG